LPRPRGASSATATVVIAGSRDAEGLYMRRSLEWLIDDGVREVIATAEVGASNGVRRGRPTHYLPSLGPEDTVYVAGPPPLVDAVKRSRARPRRAATQIRSCRTRSRSRSSIA
jgi:3-phenylpropionate/trans-cinnamate dioxygenase ferredoxin reductase subunit